jgi:hypothetical protein
MLTEAAQQRRRAHGRRVPALDLGDLRLNRAAEPILYPDPVIITLEPCAPAVVDNLAGGPREATVRWIAIVGVVVVLAPPSASAQDADRSCLDLLDPADNAPAGNEQPFLTKNRCEAIEAQELRAPLMRIPQEEEDPMELSFGIKGNGGIVRLKIPFSF